MAEFIDNTVLYRFLNKETSEEENKKIFDWVSASEENREEFRKIHHAYHISNLKQFQSEIDIEKAWDKLYNNLKKYGGKSKIVDLDLLIKVAASVLIIISTGFGSIWINEHFFKREINSVVQFEAPSGEKSKILLADGSSAWLNSETTLTYDVSNPRNVTLKGEAFFDVKKDKRETFVVETASGMKVKVTGTRFNLRCYADDPIVETTLEDGNVIILGENARRLAELNPGQQSRYNIRDNKINVVKVTPEIYSLWKNNEIRFSEISFRDLVPRIERWYGVTIELDPGISKKDHFTLSIKTESLRELLNMMKLTSNFKYEIDGSRVNIYSK
jgi:transmembrane sensor